MARTAGEAFTQMEEVAKAAGIALLTRQWGGAAATYLFRCSNGHEFERHATSVLYRTSIRCLQCERDGQRERWMEIVRKRGGQLVEGVFGTARAHYRLRCAQGHEWTTTGQGIAAGRWCPRCANDPQGGRPLDPQGLVRLQSAAAEKGGRCLATEYAGSKATYELECERGHRWHTQGGAILRGHWCPHCARGQRAGQQRRKDGLRALQAAAAAHGGVCLTEHYSGLMSRYRFRCSAGHEWESFAGSMLGGAWCTECRFDEAGETAFEKLRAAAKALGWQSLSPAWKGYSARYEFGCPDGHRFERTARALLYRGEQARCEACEADEIERRWLAAVAMRGGTLLDGPFRGLPQRYRLRCAEGHEWETTGAQISRGKWCPECGRLKSARCNVRPDGLERLQAIARGHGGKCLSRAYTRGCDPYTFECSKGHRWKSTGQLVLGGHWCAKCAGLARRLPLDEMHAIARERGGLCLSTEYQGAHVKLTWQCHLGHVWQALPSNIRSKGRWCPHCAFLRRTKDPQKRLKWDYEGRC